jgi:hypothetical protein
MRLGSRQGIESNGELIHSCSGEQGKRPMHSWLADTCLEKHQGKGKRYP